MRGRRWDDLKAEFADVVFKRGIHEVAEELPADPSTVYRLITGRTRKPCRALHEAVERITHPVKTPDE